MVVPNTPMAVTSTDSQNEGTNNPWLSINPLPLCY
jgi:hypothetical protein